jgi:hypothetical protein
MRASQASDSRQHIKIRREARRFKDCRASFFYSQRMEESTTYQAAVEWFLAISYIDYRD